MHLQCVSVPIPMVDHSYSNPHYFSLLCPTLQASPPTSRIRDLILSNVSAVNKICNLAARSWIGVQRAISAAFLLGILEEAHQDARIMGLLRSLEMVMTDRANLENSMFPGDIDTAFLPVPPPQQVASPPATQPTTTGVRAGAGSPEPPPSVSQSVHWARSTAKSLKALSKMNAALAGPQSGGAPLRGSTGAAGGGAGWGLPVTPESSGSSSGESWNLGNLGERAGEFVSKPLWGE